MKNKFIYFIIATVVVIMVSTLLKPILFASKPESMVVLVNGQAQLNDSQLILDNKEVIYKGDIIKTFGEESLAVIQWADGSLTRVGGDSHVVINQNDIASDRSEIKISFDLKQGKTWSNIVSFLGQDSYFRQTFRDVEAGARGTIFDVDLTNDYVYVHDHNIQLTHSNGRVYEIGENQPFSLETFSFIDLTKFISSIKDKAWEELNKRYDKQYLEKLRLDLLSSMQNNNPLTKIEKVYLTAHPDGLNLEQKKEKYNQIVQEYQKYNFVGSDQGELFEIKHEIREYLLAYSQEIQKDEILRSTLYDFDDALQANRQQAVDMLSPTLVLHSEIITDIKGSFFQSYQVLPEDLRSIMGENFDQLKNLFDGKIDFDLNQSIDSDTIKQGIIDIQDSAKDTIHERLDNLKDALFQK